MWRPKNILLPLNADAGSAHTRRGDHHVPWLTLAGIVTTFVVLAVAAALIPASKVLRDAQPAAAAVD